MVVRVARVMRVTWIAGLALALLALAVIGIGVAVVLFEARAQPGDASPSPRMLGSSVRLGPVEATVTSVRILPVDLSHRPAANHQFVAVSVRLVNTSQSAIPYSINDFVLQDRAENVINADIGGSILIGNDALPGQGSIPSGDKITGDIVFDAPMSDHAATVRWQPGAASSDGEAIWRLIL